MYQGYSCRFGILPLKVRTHLGAKSIWIHAVSVGEVMAIVPLVSEIRSRNPNNPLVVTVTTKTGYELAKGKFNSIATVIPSPLDFTWVVDSFIRWINPKIYIAAETEIWPNLFDALSRKNVPIAIINGRISDQSYGRYKLIKTYLKSVLYKVSLFCMQSDRDAQRIADLGAHKDRIISVGNIKFDDLSLNKDDSLAGILSFDRLWWVAGSTHPGEEEIILKIFQKYKEKCSLIIAPRHVERAEVVIQLIQEYGFKALRFSQLPSASLDSQTVIVLDTIGHLRLLYSKASLVFVGKSLCIGGGHNIIEPALYAKPIVIGPKMENFRDITALFKSQNALLQVKDADELEFEVGRLIADQDLRNQLGQKALKVVQDNQGALARTLHLLKDLIEV